MVKSRAGLPGKSGNRTAKGEKEAAAGAPTATLDRFRQEDTLGFELRITVEAMRTAMKERLDKFGIRFAHWSYLRVLWQDDGMSQIELSAKVRRVGANTVSALNALERMGLVKRVRSKADRRAIHVYLTPAGHALKTDLVGCAEDVHRVALQGILPEQEKALREMLRLIRANLEAP
jgi:DNA-binding MarR family transcriptional regulator